MNTVDPIHYTMHLEPDLKTFTFSGDTEIHVEIQKPIDEITLNAKELALWSCKVLIEDGFKECPFYVDPKIEVIRICLPREMNGKIVLKI